MVHSNTTPPRLSESSLSITPYVASALINACSDPDAHVDPSIREVLCRLPITQWRWVIGQSARFLTVDVRQEDLGRVLQEAEQRMWREAADQDVIRRCVALKAPTRFLIAFFGLHRDEIATLRQSLNVRIRGRIPSPATQDQQHIARAWAAAAGARNDVERYLRTAEATELDLRAICSVLMPVEEDFNRDKPREIAGAA